MASETSTCDYCGHEVTGATKVQLGKEGWRWHKAEGHDPIVTCGKCEETLAVLRRAAKAVEGAAA